MEGIVIYYCMEFWLNIELFICCFLMFVNVCLLMCFKYLVMMLLIVRGDGMFVVNVGLLKFFVNNSLNFVR